MASASPDNIKQWKFPDGVFLQNLSGHNAILNTLALNQDNVLVSGGNIAYLLTYLLANWYCERECYHALSASSQYVATAVQAV